MHHKPNAKIKIEKIPKLGKLGRVYNAKNRKSDEIACAKILSQFGHDIYFQDESHVNGINTPDILWKKTTKSGKSKRFMVTALETLNTPSIMLLISQNISLSTQIKPSAASTESHWMLAVI